MVMTGIHNLAALSAFLALAFSFATAFDPSPLQDFCVATNDTKSAVFLNGYLCKDPKLATVSDFFYSGLFKPVNTDNKLGVNISFVKVENLKGLNTQGLSMARAKYAPNGIIPPHHHPRGAEIITVLKGKLYTGFVTSSPEYRLFAKIMRPGDVVIVPFGLVHFQWNIGKTPAEIVATYSSQNPGLVIESNAVFGTKPPIKLDVLTKSFKLNEKIAARLQNEEWPDLLV